MCSLLRTVDNFFILPSAIVWVDPECRPALPRRERDPSNGGSLCTVRTSTGEMFDVEVTECRRVLGFPGNAPRKRRQEAR